MKNNFLIFAGIALVVLIVGVVLFFKCNDCKEKSNISNKNQKNVLNNDINAWQIYKNKTMGLQMTVPKYMKGLDRCNTNRQFWVPVKVIADEQEKVVLYCSGILL